MRCFNLAFGLFCISLSAFGEPVLNEHDLTIRDQFKAFTQQGGPGLSMPSNVHFEEAQVEAKHFLETLDKQQPELQMSPTKAPPGRILLFASFSLSDSEIASIFQRASSYDSAVVVFRGIADETSFLKSIGRIQTFANMTQPAVQAIIDPTLFRDYGVTVVPKVLVFDDQNRSFGSVAGLFDADWVAQKLAQGETGDFGVKGPVREILERDLIEVMKERVAAINWDEKKRKAKENFWKKQTYLPLPEAVADNQRNVDPTVAITRDITAPDGTMIIKAGTKINPLEMKSFDQALVVFDPLSEGQLNTVKVLAHRLKYTYNRITYIATRFDSSDGEGSYKMVTDLLDAPVFKLTPDVLSRFELKAVPATVTAQGKVFVVNEYAPIAQGAVQ